MRERNNEMNGSNKLRMVPTAPAPAAQPAKRATLRQTKAAPTTPRPKQPAAPITFSQLGSILKRPIAYHRVLAEIGGGTDAGVFLSQALYWTMVQNETNPDADGWFWKTQAEWFAETGLTRSEQETVRKKLLRRGLLLEDVRPLPAPSYQARLFFKLHRDNFLADVWSNAAPQPATLQQARPQQKRRLSRDNAAGNGAAKPQALTENTSQNKHKPPSSFGNAEAEALAKLIDDLITDAGVTPYRARKLAPLHSEELRRRLEFLPYLDNINAPGALICSHLDEAWAEPPKLTRKRKLDEDADRALAQQHAIENQQRHQAEADERSQREDDALDAHFKSLPAPDRAELHAQALDRLKRIERKHEPTPAALNAEIRRLLSQEMHDARENEH